MITNSAINFELKQHSTQEEIAAFNIFSDLLPTAHANDVGIKAFYIHVKTAYGKNLDDNLWISFVWDIQIYSTT